MGWAGTTIAHGALWVQGYRFLPKTSATRVWVGWAEATPRKGITHWRVSQSDLAGMLPGSCKRWCGHVTWGCPLELRRWPLARAPHSCLNWRLAECWLHSFLVFGNAPHYHPLPHTNRQPRAREGFTISLPSPVFLVSLPPLSLPLASAEVGVEAKAESQDLETKLSNSPTCLPTNSKVDHTASSARLATESHRSLSSPQLEALTQILAILGFRNAVVQAHNDRHGGESRASLTPHLVVREWSWCHVSFKTKIKPSGEGVIGFLVQHLLLKLKKNHYSAIVLCT